MSRAHARLNDPVTRHLHEDYARLRVDQTVADALEALRRNPPKERVVYLYVVDTDNRLVGVVPTRQLLLGQPDQCIADIMLRDVVALPRHATVLEACEFFIQHRFLAFPVVDAERRLVGVIDVELYTDELLALGPAAPVKRLLEPLTRFLEIESASGFVLLACAVAAIVIANSPWAAGYEAFWHTPMGFTIGSFSLIKTLDHWVNDGLMTLFFFVMGLEIKRELLFGELNSLKKALLPIVAAIGGMVAPALVYLALQWGKPTAHGWGIPMATDIAFVVGVLTLFGQRVPHALKIMLLTLAIVDDIGATLVIAIVYTADLSLMTLALGGIGFLAILILRGVGVRHVGVYVVVGALIWLAFVKCGVHPTVAGVALGLLTPARPWLGDRVPIDVITDLMQRLGGHWGEPPRREREPLSPLERIERVLHPWVAFVIMPVFALANAGVAIDWAALVQPVTLAVAFGLIVGKPIGIVSFSWLAIRLGVTRLSPKINFQVLWGAGCLAGIGFTMSLFIASLALDPVHLVHAKVGILGGSTISAIVGCGLLLRYFKPKTGLSASR